MSTYADAQLEAAKKKTRKECGKCVQLREQLKTSEKKWNAERDKLTVERDYYKGLYLTNTTVAKMDECQLTSPEEKKPGNVEKGKSKCAEKTTRRAGADGADRIQGKQKSRLNDLLHKFDDLGPASHPHITANLEVHELLLKLTKISVSVDMVLLGKEVTVDDEQQFMLWNRGNQDAKVSCYYGCLRPQKGAEGTLDVPLPANSHIIYTLCNKRTRQLTTESLSFVVDIGQKHYSLTIPFKSVFDYVFLDARQGRTRDGQYCWIWTFLLLRAFEDITLRLFCDDDRKAKKVGYTPIVHCPTTQRRFGDFYSDKRRRSNVLIKGEPLSFAILDKDDVYMDLKGTYATSPFCATKRLCVPLEK